MSENLPSTEVKWSVYSAAQNLPAVLNDPNRGKQSNFFVKTWGDSFVEKVEIDKSPFLPDVHHVHFETYLRKITKRHKRHIRFTQTRLDGNILSLKSKNDLSVDGTLDDVPEIFLKSSFPLNDSKVFNEVFHSKINQSDRILQEKLTHYLDIVEVQIAQQVSQKSEAFFQAMTSHDAVMEEMNFACDEVRALRTKIQTINKNLAKDSLKLLSLARSRNNQLILIDKLKLMATVLQTQPNLQLLLSSSDYVAAVELISSTQEVLVKDLSGVTSLRHLPSQLKEMSKLIDKMLSTEFEKYAAADLHRPLSDTSGILDPERLVSLIAGLLRQNHLHFLDAYKQEAITAAQIVIKQLVSEQLADVEDDMEHCLTGLGETPPNLDSAHWLRVLALASEALGKLVRRVCAVYDVIKQTADTNAIVISSETASSAKRKIEDISLSTNDATLIKISDNGLPVSGIKGLNLSRSARRRLSSVSTMCGEDKFLTIEQHRRVELKLHDLLVSFCDYCHERLATLVSTQSDRQTITAQQINELSLIVEDFTRSSEAVSGRQSAALRAAFKIQAGNYVSRFHSTRKSKMTLVLDAESWKIADVPYEFQKLADSLTSGKVLNSIPSSPSELTNGIVPSHQNSTTATVNLNNNTSNSLRVDGREYVTAGAVLILVRLVSEYCVCAYDLPVLANTIYRNLAELLRTFNSRSCQLVLGAGALRTAGLNTITATNLALTIRALKLVLKLLPHVRSHFTNVAKDCNPTALDSVERDIGHHIQQLDTKLLSIMNSLIGDSVSVWDAKPPVPSQVFRNISKQLTKLHEAVNPVLPPEQITDLYEVIHNNFKARLREQLTKMNIQNNGGPQHGVVTSELTFYVETMKTIKALPNKFLSEKAMEDIWCR